MKEYNGNKERIEVDGKVMHLCFQCMERYYEEGCEMCKTCCPHHRIDHTRFDDLRIGCRNCGTIVDNNFPKGGRTNSQMDADDAQTAWELGRGI